MPTLPAAAAVMAAIHEVALVHLGVSTKTAVAAHLGLSRQAYHRLQTAASLDAVAQAACDLGLFLEVRPDGRVSVHAPDVAPVVVEGSTPPPSAA